MLPMEHGAGRATPENCVSVAGFSVVVDPPRSTLDWLGVECHPVSTVAYRHAYGLRPAVWAIAVFGLHWAFIA